MSLRQNVIETFYRETLYLGNLFVGTIFLLDNYQGLITKGLITGRPSAPVQAALYLLRDLRRINDEKSAVSSE